MTHTIQLQNTLIGPGAPLTIIAGPCILESQTLCDEIAGTLKSICDEVGVNFVFKGSFDKANRTSINSKRGPGIKNGLSILQKIQSSLSVPVTTDIHEPCQAKEIGAVVDILQIPAFLCRQTDLLVSAASTGKIVNVKKGQFLSPLEMTHVVNKLKEANCDDMILTERGTFFGYSRLVNDFIGVSDMIELGHPVCFDVTHSTQLPGAGKDQTAGRPDRGAMLARAATASGVHALFIECHPNPSEGHSDASTMQPLENMESIIRNCAAIYELVNNTSGSPV